MKGVLFLSIAIGFLIGMAVTYTAADHGWLKLHNCTIPSLHGTEI